MSDAEEYADPVDLPAGVHHCSPAAYNHHGCRCRYCVQWRRLYDRALYYRNNPVRWSTKDAAHAYLTHRGIAAYSGRFKHQPQILARLVANYFNDDLNEWRRGPK